MAGSYQFDVLDPGDRLRRFKASLDNSRWILTGIGALLEAASMRAFREEKMGDVKWKTRVPGLGHSTPIVWEDQVFLLTAIETDEVGLWIAGEEGHSPGPHRPAHIDPLTLTDLCNRNDPAGLIA